MKKIIPSVVSVATLAVLSTACVKIESLDPIKAITKTFQTKKKKKESTRITNAKETNEEITLGSNNFKVVSASTLNALRAQGKVHPATSKIAQKLLAEAPSTSEVTEAIPADSVPAEEKLLVGFPIRLLGEQNVFGAVITKVTDSKSELLGGLKLTDLSPIHVRTAVGRTTIIDPETEEEIEVPAITLIGCVSDCSERAQQGGLISIPINDVDEENGLAYLDISAMGQGLDLISMLDPKGEYTQLKAISSAATEVNYNLTTLLFDIKTKMVPTSTPEGSEDAAPKTEFTVRWYMKLASGFNPAFESRQPTPGVGFFTTERAKDTKITRFSVTENGKKIKYYIKNVPAEYRAHFSGALDSWNAKFKEVIGTEPLTYEFVEKSDPRHALLIPGDVRFNIIEWDEENLASYGGLGPSIANQYTGETISANVLIQGPKIVELYTQWFELSKDIRALKSAGQIAQANELAHNFTARAQKSLGALKSRQFAISLGKKLKFKVHSQRPELEDPMVKNNFEVVPAGITYAEYMKGYFTEMLEHELGHNMGLRHNFKGNLGASDSGQRGSASRSIMEYLGRPFRMLNQIGLYDDMAIRYGYTGEAPKHLNWFCTDENQASSPKNIATASPECTKSDATSDPFSFWEARVDRALDMIIDLGSSSAPVWTTEEVKAQIDEFTLAFANYAAAAEKTADSWTNFFGKADRPEDKAKVKAYVLMKIKAKICNPELADAIKAKESTEASELAQKNLDELRKAMADTSKALTVFNDADLKCN